MAARFVKCTSLKPLAEDLDHCTMFPRVISWLDRNIQLYIRRIIILYCIRSDSKWPRLPSNMTSAETIHINNKQQYITNCI